ncbi:LysE family translocator [Moritella sp.]|uniref:LysE family translocator n=1 Tax=Moritella sp. TaxID=78556 RepID=UPI001DFC046E|nr:LysE family translocator [Moritella sp.]MCJ8349306.1 LysE family translocator [Moritella sp.]NQZ39592.1 LysE family translocator [Moritella sp.]
MELTAWLSLALICMMGAMTPGPSLAVVLKHTISGGRVNGVAASIAHGIGVGVYATLTVVGLALVIQQTPWLFNVIKYAGVVMLLRLAYKALTSKPALDDVDQKEETVTLKESIVQGFMIAFLNPKLAIFFLALFGQFVEADAGWLQNLIMVGTVFSIDTLWYCIIAIVLSQSSLLAKLKNNVHKIDKVTGVVLLAVAARVAI